MNRTITESGLIALVMEREKRGATFVTLQTVTDPKMVKFHRETGNPNPYLGAKKVTVINGAFGTNYESNVNRQLAREGKESDFESGPRKWGEHFQDSKTVIHHKGLFYLALRPTPQNTPQVSYVFQGAPIEQSALRPYLPPDRGSEIAEAQGVSRPVRCTDYAITSIQQISIGGEGYTVIHD